MRLLLVAVDGENRLATRAGELGVLEGPATIAHQNPAGGRGPITPSTFAGEDQSNAGLHDLRHSFASFATADGASLFMVGKALSRKQAGMTQIYVHLSDDPLKRLANRTAAPLYEVMRF